MASTVSGRRRAWSHVAIVAMSVALVAGTATASNATPSLAANGSVVVPIAGGMAEVDVATLGVSARLWDGQRLILSAPAASPLGTPGPVSRQYGVLSWSYPASGLTITAQSQDGRLAIEVRSNADGSLT